MTMNKVLLLISMLPMCAAVANKQQSAEHLSVEMSHDAVITHLPPILDREEEKLDSKRDKVKKLEDQLEKSDAKLEKKRKELAQDMADIQVASKPNQNEAIAIAQGKASMAELDSEVTGADESLEANRVRKLYASVRNVVTSEAVKVSKCHNASLKLLDFGIAKNQPSNGLLEGVHNMVGISKVKAKLLNFYETLAAGENKCIVASNAMQNEPGAGDLLQTAETSQLAQYLAQDADSVAQLADCEATLASIKLAAFTEFFSALTTLGSYCMGTCNAAKAIVPTWNAQSIYLTKVKQGFQNVHKESTSLKEQLQDNPLPNSPTTAFQQHVQRMKEIVKKLDETENQLLIGKADWCKTAARYFSLLPPIFGVSESEKRARECSTEDEAYALEDPSLSA